MPRVDLNAKRRSAICLVATLASLFLPGGASIRPASATVEQDSMSPTQANAIDLRAQELADLGKMSFKLSDYASAIRAYTALLKLKPGDARVFFNRGNAYYHMQELDRAVEDFSEALRLEPNLVPALINRGNIYFQKNQHAEALADYERIAVVMPNDAATMYRLAIACARSGLEAKALTYFTRAIEINPSYAPARAERGHLYLGIGKSAEAREDLKVALKLDPGNIRAQFGLQLLERTAEATSAAAEIEANSEAAHGKPVKTFLDTLDTTCFKNGDDIDALRGVAKQLNWNSVSPRNVDALVNEALSTSSKCNSKRPSCRRWLAMHAEWENTGGWSGKSGFGKTSMAQLVSQSRRLTVCALSTENIAPHIYGEINLAFGQRYGVRRTVAEPPSDVTSTYEIPHRSTCQVEARLIFQTKPRKLIVRMTHQSLAE